MYKIVNKKRIVNTIENYKRVGDYYFFLFFDSNDEPVSSENNKNIDEHKVTYSEDVFESIKHINEHGQEFWYARDLQKALEYTEWRNFLNVINKAKINCKTSNFAVFNHFVDVNKTIDMPKGASKEIPDIQLSRYAAYLIVLNADPDKEVVALGKTYFAVKTRQQELIENYEALSEDQKRLAIRHEMIDNIL